MSVKCLAQEHNTMTQARAQIWTVRFAPELSALTMRPPRLPLYGKTARTLLLKILSLVF